MPTTRPASAPASGEASDALDAVQRDALSELLRLTPVVDRLGELFVAAGHELYLVGGSVRDALLGRLRSTIRTVLSPRHVPDEVFAVPEVPRTLNGKKLEVPVKRLLTGTPFDKAVSLGAVANPDALEHFVALAHR